MINEFAAGLSFRMSKGEAQMFRLVSVVPFFVVAAHIALLVMELIWGQMYYGFSNDLDDPEFVRRLNAFLDVAVYSGQYIALAILFMAGIAQPSRAVGSWSAMIALILLTAALVLWVYSAAPYLVVSTREYDTIEDLRIDLAVAAATTLSLVTAGYAFLAYRGFSEGAVGAEAESADGSDAPPDDDQPIEL